MTAGDITLTTYGPFYPNDPQIKVLMDTQSTGATTAGGDTTTFEFVPSGKQVFIHRIVRAAS